MLYRSPFIRVLLAAAMLAAILAPIGQGETAKARAAQPASQSFIPANGESYGPAFSADGRYVAFQSNASNLVAEDTNGTWDTFVRDRQTGTTEIVSLSSIGEPANGNSYGPALSVDGRYVAFESNASNLVAGDTNGTWDIFVRDRQTGTTEIISLSPSGEPANGDSYGPSLSADGRYVAFYFSGSNLVVGDTNGIRDIFLRDRHTDTTEIVSLSPSGVPANGISEDPALSADARYVAFMSGASNLVTGDTNSAGDIFVRNRQTGTTEIVSLSPNGEPANGHSSSPVLSADGRYVAFLSWTSNLVAGDTNGIRDIFVRDRQTGMTEIVSLSPSGEPANGESWSPALSADGRYVAFQSNASNLVAGDTHGTRDIFVHDRQTGTTEIISFSPSGEPANNTSGYPSLSADGHYVSFHSAASNLMAGDTNGFGDIFVRDRQTGTTEIISVGAGSQAPVLSGRVTTAAGAGLAGTTIRAVNSAGVSISVAQADVDGAYAFSNLPAGSYRLTPNLIGYLFTPQSLSVTVPGASAGQNFIGSPVSCGAVSSLTAGHQSTADCINPFPQPFLDLPIHYQDFRVAAQGNEGKPPGKVNSWFDHLGPNDANRGDGKMQIYTGKTYPGQPSTTCSPRGACYDGHNALDFQHDYSKPNEEVQAAGDGVVVDVCHRDPLKYPGETCGRYFSFGKYILIDHENGYSTFYAHLERIEVAIGQRVWQRDPIGIMGKTGGWKAVHLHFSVYYNPNYRAGNLDLSQWNYENAVDPYGWQGASGDHWRLPSYYLWETPLVDNSQIRQSGGVCKQDDVQVTIPKDALSDPSIVSVGAAPAPAGPPSVWRLIQSFFIDIYRLLSGTNAAVYTMDLDEADQPFTVTIQFDPTQLQHLDPAQAKIFYWNEVSASWEGLDTSVDLNLGTASAQTTQTGNFTLQAPLHCVTDANEPNDSPESASRLTDGSYGLDLLADQDWFVLEAQPGTHYRIRASNLSSGMRLELQLRSSDAQTVILSSKDDAPIEWTAEEDAQVFLRVAPVSGSTTGCQATYGLSISSAPGEPTQPTLPPGSAIRLFLPLISNPNLP